MQLTRCHTIALLAVTSVAAPISTYTNSNTTIVGPENGHLINVGESSYNSRFPAALPRQPLGANITVLHTYDSAVADTYGFVAPLQSATSILLGGIRVRSERSRIRISADANIIGSPLARGDTWNNTVMVGDHIVGFGCLKKAAIYQHVLVQNRHLDMIEGLDTSRNCWNTAVFGSTNMIVYNGGFWWREGAMRGRGLIEDGRFYFWGMG
ncbi:hypothetical protein DE146DRAFT_682317 [Phaeosphaeria sp. MPI-PUGE-AT-0046c]|nr:hypothetical protein DE146DRAFT_682317 [Phaeosphaeria sp. MPI-PUGE-AT-0046c]